MSARKNLIELLLKTTNVFMSDEAAEIIADHLLENGVTFAADTNVGDKLSPTADSPSADWISVEDRLPDVKRYGTSDVVLACETELGRCLAMIYGIGKSKRWFCGGAECSNVTHWMPLPSLPTED